MRRALQWLSASLLVVVLAVLAGLVWLLQTQNGSLWLLGRVPSLRVEGFQGRLGGSWQAEDLRWQQAGLRVRVQQPNFAWSAGCLLKGALCLDQLRVERVEIDLPSSEKSADAGPPTLPTIRLPIRILLSQLHLGSLVLNGVELLSDLNVQARLLPDGLHLDSLGVRRQAIQVSLSGQLAMQKGWPVQLQGQVQLPRQQDKDWSTELSLVGDVAKELHLTVLSKGYLEASLEAWASPLDKRLPARLQVRSEAFKAVSSLPETLTLKQFELDAAGSLQDGFRLSGKGRLPAEKQPVNLVLESFLTAQGAQLKTLELAADPQHRLALQGEVDWQKGLSAKAVLDWQDFPWQSLYPGLSSPVSARRLQAQVAYAEQGYQGSFSADLTGPAGPFSLASPVKGDLKHVELPALQVSAGRGHADGLLWVGFAEGIQWQTDLRLSNLDPGYWVAPMPGNLTGTLTSKGSLRDQHLQAEGKAELRGRLRGQPAELHLAAQGEDARWQLAKLAAHLGDNSLDGQGTLGQRLEGRLNLALNNLGQLWPGLRGQVKGRVDLAGSLQEPQGQISLQTGSVGLNDNSVASLDLQASLGRALQGSLRLRALGLQSGANQLGDLQVDAKGDSRRQALQLALKGPLLNTALAFDGELIRGDWRGQLATGEVAAKGMTWRLAQPVKLVRLANGRLTSGAHCWNHASASLCMEDQQLLPDTSLNVHLRQFPLDELAQWLPKDFAWQGRLNVDAQFKSSHGGPQGVLNLDAGAGRLRLHGDEGWQDFPYSRLTLVSHLTPQRVDNELNFDGGPLGRLLFVASLDPKQASMPITGHFSLEGLDLAIARPFAPGVQELKGQLNGSGSLAGVLRAPQVNGHLRLADGLVAGPELPTRLEQLQLDADISGTRMTMQGGWRSGEQGRASLSGAMEWQNGLSLSLSLQGKQLPIDVKPYAELQLEPDLRLGLVGQRLTVSGQVGVPSGAIHVRQLPPSTVKVSQDTVVVGKEPPQSDASNKLQLAMDVDVDVGQKHLSFSAFGLDALLKGRVHIGDNLDTRGELNLNEGHFRAYGQNLDIRRARLQFLGPIDQPYLDVEAVRHADTDNVTAGIRLTGSLAEPETQLFSDPEMGQDQALSYLLLGHATGGGTEDSNMLANAALGMGLAGTSSITGDVGKRLGVHNLQLGTKGNGSDTSVVASGDINDRLSLRYGMGVFEAASSIGLRYKLTKKIYLEAVSGLASSLDVFYHRDF